jgi:hypothetical protein
MKTSCFGDSWWAVAVTVLGVWVGGGCSALSSRPPVTVPLASLSECSRSRAPAIGDVIMAGVAGGTTVVSLGIAAIQKSAAENEIVPSWDPHTRADANVGTFVTVGIIAAAATVGLVASARYGFHGASECRAAQQELLLRSSPPQPPPWYPPPPSYPQPPWYPPPPSYPQPAPGGYPSSPPPPAGYVGYPPTN